MLERAVRSVLEQTHSSVELVISDNASSDGTESFCREVAERDHRVRYVRQAHDIGQTANYNFLFQSFRTPYSMVLADDDWLDPGYVERCLSVLLDEPDCVAVSGRARYWRGSTRLDREGLRLRLAHPDGVRRVQALARAIGEGRAETSMFFGVMPTEVLEQAMPMPNVLGSDIVMAARIVFQGGVRTLDDVCLNRSVGGTSVSMASIAAALGLPARQARWPDLVIAWHILRDLGWQNATYADMTPAMRLGWGLRCAFAAINWRSFAWHATAPAAAALGRRSRGGWVWALYDRLARTLGAGSEQGRLLRESRTTQ